MRRMGMSDQLLGTWFQPGFPASWEQAIARFFLGPTSAIRKSDFLASISLLLVSKSDFLASISLLLVRKSDFLVADQLTSFSDDLSTLRRNPSLAKRDGPPAASLWWKIGIRLLRETSSGWDRTARRGFELWVSVWQRTLYIRTGPAIL